MRLTERLRTLPPAGQVALAAATLLVTVALLGLTYLAMKPRYEILFRDLRPADAATIVAELDKQKVAYKLTDGGGTILAPAAAIDATRLSIMGADLPLKGTVGFELFNKSDMGLTEFAQRINYQRALQGELARTIMTIEGVDAARVHLTLPEPSIFRADRKPAKASVTLTVRPGKTLSPDLVAGIQRLVAASVSDLSAAEVVVLDGAGRLATPSAEVAAVDPDLSPSTRQLRAIEQYYEAKSLRALRTLGRDVSVSVSIPAGQWSDDADREEALDTWTPAARTFSLALEASAPGGVDEGLRDEIGALLTSEVGWSQALGDVLVFADAEARMASEPTPSIALPLEPTPPSRPSASAVDTPGGLWVGLLAVLAAAGLFATLALRERMRRRRPRTLTEAERDAYAKRLQGLLAEDG